LLEKILQLLTRLNNYAQSQYHLRLLPTQADTLLKFYRNANAPLLPHNTFSASTVLSTA